MKQPKPQQHWPDSWKLSYRFDLEEAFGPISNHGYAYAYDERRTQTLRLLQAAVAPGARVLDIAAAQGNFSLRLAELGYRVTWNDLRSELAAYTRLKHEHGEIQYAPGNVFDLRFEAPFDAVLITEIIEHVAHPDDFLRQVAQLVRPGGHVIMTTPNGAYFRNTLPKFSDCGDPSAFEAQQFQPDGDGHIFLLHPEEVHRLAQQSGLVVEELRLFTNPVTNGHMKTEALLRRVPRRWVDRAERASQALPPRLARKVLLQMGARLVRPA